MQQKIYGTDVKGLTLNPSLEFSILETAFRHWAECCQGRYLK